MIACIARISKYMKTRQCDKCDESDDCMDWLNWLEEIGKEVSSELSLIQALLVLNNMQRINQLIWSGDSFIILNMLTTICPQLI